MNRKDFLNGFQFDHDAIIDQQINSVSAIQPNTLVLHRQFYLAPKADPSQA